MLTAFLPGRRGSERIANKNTKDFAKIKGGLLSIKLAQLDACPHIDEIIVSTNDNECIRVAEKMGSPKVKVLRRPENLALNSTNLDDLISYVPKICRGEHFLWTHVTAPFLDSANYSSIIQNYFSKIDDGFDSLMTVNKIQGFLWDADKQEITNSPPGLNWPRTQDLSPTFEITSGAFINSREGYLVCGNRIGSQPYLHELNTIQSFDIDWPEQFDLAERIFLALNG